MISNSFLFFKIILVKSLFFQTFCKKSLRFFKIIIFPCPQLSILICFCLHKTLNTSSNATFVKITRSGLSFSYFHFLFNLFSFILFLELGLGLEWQDHTVAQQVTWYMEGCRIFWKRYCYITYNTHIDLKVYIQLFRVG